MKDFFVKLSEYNNIYVYGAGFVAKLFYNWYVGSGGDVENLSFVISGTECGEIGGISILNFFDIEPKSNSICIVAVRDKEEQIKIGSKLNDKGFLDVILINENLYRKLYSFDPVFSLSLENQNNMSHRFNQLIGRNDEQHVYLSTLGEKIYKSSNDVERFLIKRMTRAILNFEVQVVEHCNLNCAGCDHFSPIAKKEFLDLMWYTKDLNRLAEITEGNVGRIKLLGGEPLLHPEISKIICQTRYWFQNAQIELVSNGILLNKMTEEFWMNCKNNRVDITVTKYPVNIDFENMCSLARMHEVNLSFISADVEKTLWKLPLDEQGRQDPSVNFYRCWRINNCISLEKGKIFSCVIPAHVHHFNKAFNKNIPITQKDYIDIYEVKNIREILEFCSSPLPFCRYCNVCSETNGHPWKVSSKIMEEWI